MEKMQFSLPISLDLDLEFFVCLFQYVGEHSWLGDIRIASGKPEVIEKEWCREHLWGATLLNGGTLSLCVDDPDEGDDGDFSLTKTITLEDVRTGIDTMANHSKRHFGDLIDPEKADFWTYDTALQYIVYKEHIYG